MGLVDGKALSGLRSESMHIRLASIGLGGTLDEVCLIWDKWNRREISSEQAIREIGHYLQREVDGARKRRELLKSSVRLSSKSREKREVVGVE